MDPVGGGLAIAGASGSGGAAEDPIEGAPRSIDATQAQNRGGNGG